MYRVPIKSGHVDKYINIGKYTVTHFKYIAVKYVNYKFYSLIL